jgi:hypothetical protein
MNVSQTKDTNKNAGKVKRKGGKKRANNARKKQAGKGGKKNTQKMNWKGLVWGIVNGLIELIVVFIVGARVLFACKIAQFNILPTDINCMPYRPNYDKSKKSPDFQSFSPEASIDTMYVDSGEDSIPFATQIKYDINEESMKYKILDFIRKIEYKPKVGSFVKYAMVCITHIFVFFYGLTSFTYNKLNEYLPEWAIILLGPLVLSLFLVLLVPVTLISTLVISLTNMKWLLHKNMNTDSKYKFKNAEKPVWMYVDPTSNLTNLMGSIAYIFLGILFALNLGITPIPYLIGLVSFFSPLFMSAIVAGGKKDELKKYGFKSSIKGLIETKMTMFSFLFGLVVINATAKHGTTPAVIMVSIATAYFLYRQYKAEKVPPKTSTSNIVEPVQNKRFCPKPKMTKKELMEMERDKMDLGERFENESVIDKVKELKNKTQSQAMRKSVLEPERNIDKVDKTITPIDLPSPSQDIKVETELENNSKTTTSPVTEPTNQPKGNSEPNNDVVSKGSVSITNPTSIQEPGIDSVDTPNTTTIPSVKIEDVSPNSQIEEIDTPSQSVSTEQPQTPTQKGGSNITKREKLLEKKLTDMRKSIKKI